MTLKTSLLRAGLDTLHATGVYQALAPFTSGTGMIFTLHRFRDCGLGGNASFAPNRILDVTPAFLEATITRVRERGFDIVSLDEACRRIAEGEARRFAVFTIDDGYRDTAEVAWPVFRRLECPFTVYVATGLVDRTAHFWWISLERAIAARDAVEFGAGGSATRYPCGTVAQKCVAFDAIYWQLRAMGEGEKLDAASEFAARCGVDPAAIVDEVAMTWDDALALARDPLVTIGAHTVSHAALGKIDEADMQRELIDGRARLAEMLGEVPRHLAYPYGDPGSAGPREFAAAEALGYDSAVTTRKGVIHADHAGHMTALPRVSLNGDYQDLRYVDVFLSGAPFALMRGFRRVDAS